MAPRRWHKLVPTATLAVAALTLTGQTAHALFPPIWPRPQVPTVVVPPAEPPGVIVVPPVDPPVDPPLPPIDPPLPPVDPQTPNPPTGVPEPSTMVLGAAGLAAAAGWRTRRRKRGPDEGK